MAESDKSSQSNGRHCGRIKRLSQPKKSLRRGRTKGSPTGPRHGWIELVALPNGRHDRNLNRRLSNLASSRLNRKTRRDRIKDFAMVEQKTPERGLVMAQSDRSPQLNQRHNHDQIEGYLIGPHYGRVGEVAAPSGRHCRSRIVIAQP